LSFYMSASIVLLHVGLLNGSELCPVNAVRRVMAKSA
jgi:hypothetical protein